MLVPRSVNILYVGDAGANEFLEYGHFKAFLQSYSDPSWSYLETFESDLRLASKYIRENDDLNIIVIGNTRELRRDVLEEFARKVILEISQRVVVPWMVLKDELNSVAYLKPIFEKAGITADLSTEIPFSDVVEMNWKDRCEKTKQKSGQDSQREKNEEQQKLLPFMDF